MATTSLWKIDKRLDRVIDYAIKQAWSYKQFVNILNNMRYFMNIRAGKLV